MMKEPKEEKVKAAMDALLELFERDEAIEVTARHIIPANLDAPSARWSLSNRVIMFLHGTSDARGYQQWQSVSRHVKAGSKAVYILAPCVIKVAVKDENGNGRKDENGKPIVESRLVGFTAVPVFRIEDTDGAPLPDLAPNEPPPLREVADRWGLSVRYMGFIGGYYGYYSGGERTIALATHDCKTFFHELGHAADERVKGRLKGGQDWRQEITAEFAAAVLCRLYCPDWPVGGSREYIEGYAREGKLSVPAAMIRLFGDVEAVLKEILGAAATIAAAA